MKGISYLAAVVKTYREALDAYGEDPLGYRTDPRWVRELDGIFHRDYCTGFYFNQPDQILPNYENRQAGRVHSFIGKATECSSGTPARITLDIKNKLRTGAAIEILSPKGPPATAVVLGMADHSGGALETAQPNTRARVTLSASCREWDIIRTAP
jgi:putative protease